MITLPFTRAELNLPIASEVMPRRSSVSGVQDKVSLSRRRGKFEIVTSLGEYILKPVPSMPLPCFQKEVPANEALTMSIAERIFSIAVAEHELVMLADGEYAYLTKRFDYRDGVKTRQEDFCQLSNRSRVTHGENYKYDSSYEECGRIVRQFCPAAEIEIRKLFRRILFSYVFSNGDAHLRNFSLGESIHGDAVMTPAYDLVATSLHVPTETALALDLFANGYLTPRYGELGFYSSADFIELGRRFGIGADEVRGYIARYASSAVAVRDMIASSCLGDAAKVEYARRFADRVKAVTM